MRIPGELSKIAGIYESQKTSGKINRTEAVASKKDVLQISGKAKDFQTVYKALKDVPDIREAKVNEIAGRFEAGSYNVTGQDVAEKVVSTVFDRKA
jgi:negative regulator of flagellin synthesis FlgM